MASEKLKFELELFATKWDKNPTCEIMINNQIKWSDEISGTEENPTKIKFEAELEEDKEHVLTLNRQGKDNKQTIINEKGDILKDQLLHIKSINIDEIDIASLVYEGIYTPEYPEPWATQHRDAGNELKESFKNATILGHNGKWTFKFTSPFYMWLLENLY